MTKKATHIILFTLTQHMKKILPFLALSLLIVGGCGQNTDTQTQSFKTDCDSTAWNCPSEKTVNSGTTFNSTKASQTSVVIEILESEQNLEELYNTKKSEVQKYQGNEITEESELQDGKYFVNKNTFSNNILLRAIISKNNKIYMCSGYSPEKTFESVRQEMITLCENLKPTK